MADKVDTVPVRKAGNLTVELFAVTVRISRSAAYRLARRPESGFERVDGSLLIRKEEVLSRYGLTDLDEDFMMTAAEVAHTCGLCDKTVLAWCRAGDLGVHVGKYWRIPFSSFKDFARKRLGEDVALQVVAS